MWKIAGIRIGSSRLKCKMNAVICKFSSDYKLPETNLNCLPQAFNGLMIRKYLGKTTPGVLALENIYVGGSNDTSDICQVKSARKSTGPIGWRSKFPYKMPNWVSNDY